MHDLENMRTDVQNLARTTPVAATAGVDSLLEQPKKERCRRQKKGVELEDDDVVTSRNG